MAVQEADSRGTGPDVEPVAAGHVDLGGTAGRANGGRQTRDESHDEHPGIGPVEDDSSITKGLFWLRVRNSYRGDRCNHCDKRHSRVLARLGSGR